MSSTTTKPWPKPFIDCTGDYTSEQFIETHTGGSLYSNQPRMPNLPVPSISETLEKLLPTALPLARTPQERTAFSSAVEEFAKSNVVSQLQTSLEHRATEASASTPPTSWLQNWWNHESYLKYRETVLINVSYFFHLADDPTTSSNIQRAAAILYSVGEYRKGIVSGTAPPEVLGRKKTPLCATAFKYMFHASRIPKLEMDGYRIYDPSGLTHVVVVRKGLFFKLDFLDGKGNPLPLTVLEKRIEEVIRLADAKQAVGEAHKIGWLTSQDRDSWTHNRELLLTHGGEEMQTGWVSDYDPNGLTHVVVCRKGLFFKLDFLEENGNPLPLNVLEDRIQQVIQLADAKQAVGDAHKIGWLTSQDRDSWTHNRELLLEHGGEEMQNALTTLESGAFLLCLDDEEPTSRIQCGELFLMGKGKDPSSAANRWFDKSIQIFCTNNAKVGLLGEHSMMDGMPVIGVANHIANSPYASIVQKTKSRSDPTDSGSSGGVTHIFDHLLKGDNAVVQERIHKAMHSWEELVEAHTLNVESFQSYGASQIKQWGYSPDAFVQMAVQLATFRLFGEQAGTYEATQVRTFLHGRTEVTRAVTSASEAFVKRMGEQPHESVVSKEAARLEKLEKVTLLGKAVAAHVAYMRDAARGHGVDRHLFGLAQLNTSNAELALFSDPVYQRSKRWRVSTSHLTHPKFDNWGFGEVVPDGVGVGYAVKAENCMFNIMALTEHGYSERLGHLLEESLLELKSLHVGMEPSGGLKSKL
eukprot:CAMPEP_0194397988 /NCGR_PEP_ID=MMETSP0174-20130528/125853_1 /TAXON_ID=216777 /ORGANISM="Proboscia alata, Strain PI-D3" /LENGTH=752 /DNA_ID=CAMNT_0039194233 /DNA_START=65 /DNA_END=2324 /DNA_ORIENTATION=+